MPLPQDDLHLRILLGLHFMLAALILGCCLFLLVAMVDDKVKSHLTRGLLLWLFAFCIVTTLAFLPQLPVEPFHNLKTWPKDWDLGMCFLYLDLITLFFFVCLTGGAATSCLTPIYFLLPAAAGFLFTGNAASRSIYTGITCGLFGFSLLVMPILHGSDYDFLRDGTKNKDGSPNQLRITNLILLACTSVLCFFLSTWLGAEASTPASSSPAPAQTPAAPSTSSPPASATPKAAEMPSVNSPVSKRQRDSHPPATPDPVTPRPTPSPSLSNSPNAAPTNHGGGFSPSPSPSIGSIPHARVDSVPLPTVIPSASPTATRTPSPRSSPTDDLFDVSPQSPSVTPKITQPAKPTRSSGLKPTPRPTAKSERLVKPNPKPSNSPTPKAQTPAPPPASPSSNGPIPRSMHPLSPEQVAQAQAHIRQQGTKGGWRMAVLINETGKLLGYQTVDNEGNWSDQVHALAAGAKVYLPKRGDSEILVSFSSLSRAGLSTSTTTQGMAKGPAYSLADPKIFEELPLMEEYLHMTPVAIHQNIEGKLVLSESSE